MRRRLTAGAAPVALDAAPRQPQQDPPLRDGVHARLADAATTVARASGAAGGHVKVAG